MELNFTPFPVLETERLILRKIKEEDDAALFKLRSDVRVMKHIGRPIAQTIEDAQGLLKRLMENVEDNTAVTWAITLKGDDTLIGTIGFWQIQPEHSRGEIGYTLAYDFHRKGLMGEAIKKVIEYGFKIMKFHSIEADTSPANVSSMALLEKNGFVREGYFRENFYFEGKYFDTVVYGMLNPDGEDKNAKVSNH